MFTTLHAAYLTGTATVVENDYLTDSLRFDRPRYSLGQMFFKPYEEKEFIFCARTFIIAAWWSFSAFIDPSVLLFPLGLTVIFAVGLLTVAGFAAALDEEDFAVHLVISAANAFLGLFQQAINMVLSPVLGVSLVTRGLSSVLQGADIYDYDAQTPTP